MRARVQVEILDRRTGACVVLNETVSLSSQAKRKGRSVGVAPNHPRMLCLGRGAFLAKFLIGLFGAQEAIALLVNHLVRIGTKCHYIALDRRQATFETVAEMSCQAEYGKENTAR